MATEIGVTSEGRERPEFAPPKLLSPSEFLTDFVGSASKEKHRIIEQTMYFKAGSHVSETMAPILIDAAQRGTQVTWGIDHYIFDFPDTQLQKKPFRRLTSQELDQKKANDALFTILRKAGVNLIFPRIGKFRSKLIPFSGRVHSKFAVVGDTSYLSEANLDDSDFSFINNVMMFTDPKVADTVTEYADMIHTEKKFDDYSVAINAAYTFYADAGRPGKSLIQDTAVEMIKNPDATDIYWATQLKPVGKFAKELVKQAQEGKRIHILASDNLKGTMDKLAAQENISITYAEKKVHAKSLLVKHKEDADEGMFTTHNLHLAGVIGGTGEIAMRSTDPAFIGQMEEFFGSHIN